MQADSRVDRDDDATRAAPTTPGSSNKLFERPPLEVDVRKEGLSFTLIGNHLASQSHPEALPPGAGDRSCTTRPLASRRPAGRSWSSATSTTSRTAPALTQNLVAQGVTLKNLWSEAPADNRYSFQFDGQLQTLDHIFVTDGLHAGVRDVRYVHFDNDYFERDETRHAAGVSDHDPPLVTIALPGDHHDDGGVATPREAVAVVGLPEGGDPTEWVCSPKPGVIPRSSRGGDATRGGFLPSMRL